MDLCSHLSQFHAQRLGDLQELIVFIRHLLWFSSPLIPCCHPEKLSCFWNVIVIGIIECSFTGKCSGHFSYTVGKNAISWFCHCLLRRKHSLHGCSVLVCSDVLKSVVTWPLLALMAQFRFHAACNKQLRNWPYAASALRLVLFKNS